VIAVEDVSHRLGERLALDGVSVTFAEQRVGVIGANGSRGCSTGWSCPTRAG
jgi:ATPase subunit of ABC transporter with duplicated ATPase domains